MPLTHKSEPLAGEASPVSRSEKVHQKGLNKKSSQNNSRNWTPDIDGQNRQCRHTCKCRIDWIQMLSNKMEFLIDKISSDLKKKNGSSRSTPIMADAANYCSSEKWIKKKSTTLDTRFRKMALVNRTTNPANAAT